MVELSIHGNYPVEDLPEDYTHVMERVRESLTLLDAEADSDFDELTRLVGHLDGVPLALRALESRLTFRLSVLSKLLDKQAQEMLEGTGINLTDYRILNVLNAIGNASITDISRFCAAERANISERAGDLAKQGIVAFESDPDSRRKKVVVLTHSGRELLNSIHPMFLERNEELEQLLGYARREAFVEAINILTDITVD